MLVIAVVIAGVVSFFGEMIFRFMFQSARFGGGRSGNGGGGGKKGGAGIAILIAIGLIVVCWLLSVRHPLRAVAAAGNFWRTQVRWNWPKSRCDDHGAAQDRRPRRTRRAPIPP